MNDETVRLPQFPRVSDAVVQSVEWLFEPYWNGERLLAEVEDGRVTLTDEDGNPASDDLAEAEEVIRGALFDVESAVIDGVWTNKPFTGEGSAARHLAEAIAEEGLSDELPDPIANEKRRAFVAVDLVELDGMPLYDVPYVERRRLLSSVIEENVRVRISPSVRMPVFNWLEAWHATGFQLCIAKHMNSRYHPGEVADDWLILPTQRAAGPGALARLVGIRPKKVVHVDDVDPSPPRD